jgi:hypothetical protein
MLGKSNYGPSITAEHVQLHERFLNAQNATFFLFSFFWGGRNLMIIENGKKWKKNLQD